MTRIIGSLLGVSFQTELLIMTLLGLANSTLDWKPFELVLRLNLIRDLHLSVNDVKFSNNFTLWIKKLLSGTVILEFICSLLNPLVHLLKLYPVITWSRSDVLLPWLYTHALNTIFPKVLSLILAFIFYYERVISTKSLIEFLIVESINLSIAGYNWYVFFSFYQDLREVEQARISNPTQEKVSKTRNAVPGVYSNTSCGQEMTGEASINSDEFRKLCSTSLSFVIEENDGKVEYDDLTTPPSSSTHNKSMKILHDTRDRRKNARKHKRSLNMPKMYKVLVNKDSGYTLHDGKSSGNEKEGNFENTRAGSSSEDDNDEEKIEGPHPISDKKISKEDQPPKWHSIVKNKKTRNIGVQVIEKPDDALVFSPSVLVNHQKYGLSDKDINFPFLLKENFELLDKMCRTMNANNQNTPKSTTQKWLIFRHEFESSLGSSLFFKESRSNISKSSSLNNLQLEKSNDNDFGITHTVNVKAKNMDSKWNNYLKNATENGHDFPWNSSIDKKSIPIKKAKTKDIANVAVSRYFDIYRISKADSSSGQSNGSSRRSYRTFTKSTLPNPFGDSSKFRKANISVLKSAKPIHWLEQDKTQKDRELRNLQAYNNLTLEQDRREMQQKKKKSKMSSYKKAITEITVQNSDVTGTNTQPKLNNDRTCKSDQAWEKVNKNAYNRVGLHESKTQLAGCSGFLNDALIEATEISEDTQELQTYTNEFSKPKHDGSLDTVGSTNVKSSLSSNEQTMNVQNLDFNKAKPILIARTTSHSISTPAETTVAENHQAAIPARASIRETIDRIDWSCPPNFFGLSSSQPPGTNKTQFASRAHGIESSDHRSIIVDDETVSMLQNAFSFSDDSDRGFHLGPESSEPYPIFQVVALTMAEIFKATGWRNFADALPAQPSGEFDDVIFCDTELTPETEQSDLDSERFDVFTEITKDLGEEKSDEIEQRKTVSAYLLDQLQELIDSSRETLTAIENSRNMDVSLSKLKSADNNDEIPANSNCRANSMDSCKRRGSTDDAQTCNDEISRNMSFNQEIASHQRSNPCNFNTSQSDEYRYLKFLGDGKDNFRAANEENEVSVGATATESSSLELPLHRAYETKFENKLQKHLLRKGKGLSSGYVMEYDSEGRVLTTIQSRNASFSGKLDVESIKSGSRERNIKKENTKILKENTEENDSENSLIKLFDSFQEKITEQLKNDKDSAEFKEKLKELAQSDTFSSFISLFENEDMGSLMYESATNCISEQTNQSRVVTEYINNQLLNIENEIELKSSEFQNNENVLENQINDYLMPINNANIAEETNKGNVESSINQDNLNSTDLNVQKTTEMTILDSFFADASEPLKNHRQYLESDIIKQRIANWNTDSIESSDSFIMRKNSKPVESVSFSDNSDMEEFPGT